jgi:hypothetical protein
VGIVGGEQAQGHEETMRRLPTDDLREQVLEMI